VNFWGSALDQGCVETVAVARKTAFRQPLGHFHKHTYYQVDVTGTILASQPHIDRQADGFATPGRRYSQRKDHQIQATGEDYIEGGTNRVSPSRSAIDLSAGTIEEGVVCVQRDSAFGIEDFHQQYRQYFPQLRQSPSCGWKETVKCIVRLYAQGVGKGQYARYGSPSGADNPAGDQLKKNLACWSSKNRQKVLDYIRPCRYSNCGIHTSLPFLLFPRNLSEGWYVFAYSFSKLVA
jgi:hypothetical protein